MFNEHVYYRTSHTACGQERGQVDMMALRKDEFAYI